MNQLDAYYRALLNYRKCTAENNDCKAFRSAFAESNFERDELTINRAMCTIDEDWVEAIEKGLVHVEKAIKEERQFIRSNGEVVPIEKVKHVSKESVEHLAKHSSLITRYTEGEDIVPDKLYTVERLSDYAVYENRFLYMLLCYLRDFVTLRYNAILDLTNKYDATFSIEKSFVVGKQKVAYTMQMKDVRRDDKYLKEHNPAKDIIDRIDIILKAILAFLATPLMESVSKVAMIKPPITKTNVLKMNNNFKGAVALYDFIVSYDKPGYTVEQKKQEISPFRDSLADEIAEAGALISFLAYEYGLGIKQDLKDSYQMEEERLKAEEIQREQERLEAMLRRLKKSEISIEEYAASLEKQNKQLVSEVSRVKSLADQLIAVKAENRRIGEECDSWRLRSQQSEQELDKQKIQHFEEICRIKAAHEDEMHELIIQHEAKVEALCAEHDAKIETLCAEHSAEVAALNESARAAQEAFEAAMLEQRTEAAMKLEAVTGELNGQLSLCKASLQSALSNCDALTEKNHLAEARIKALGGIDHDYSDRESFGTLEAEYNALRKIYREQWSLARKGIIQKYLNIANIKGIKEQKENDGENNSD